MKKITLIIVVILYSLHTYAQLMSKYEGNGLTISYPATWDSMSYPPTKFLFLRPVEEEGQKFRENINLIISDSKELTLDECVGVSKLQLGKQLSNYKFVSTNKNIIDGKTCSEIVYQHSMNGLDYQVQLYIFIIDGKAYEFTCSSLQSTYDRFHSLFGKMIDSLHFTN